MFRGTEASLLFLLLRLQGNHLLLQAQILQLPVVNLHLESLYLIKSLLFAVHGGQSVPVPPWGPGAPLLPSSCLPCWEMAVILIQLTFLLLTSCQSVCPLTFIWSSLLHLKICKVGKNQKLSELSNVKVKYIGDNFFTETTPALALNISG